MALSRIKKWQFPVIKGNNNIIDGTLYYKALLSVKNGFYPIGLNKLVHMGIHIDKDALDKLGIGEPIKTKVNCIADGEVIAYRVNDHYPKVDYGDKVAFFSTGFVLVRHLLEMDLAPEKKVETTQSNPPATENTTQSQASNADTNSASNLTSASANPAPTTAETTKKEKKNRDINSIFTVSICI